MELDYRLKEIIYQCDMHKKRILYAKNKIDFIPLTPQKYDYLVDEEIEHLDQLIFRFSKLQDTMGNKLFALILELKGEDIKPMSFFDRLNRLEELGFVTFDEWIELREIRNSVAHEYFSNKYQIVDSLNNLYEASDTLLKIYDNCKNLLGLQNG